MIYNKGENLVFLLSLPRSGSTLLSLLLGSHSDILCPPEPWFLLKLAALTQPCSVENIVDDELAAIGTKEFVSDETLIEASRAFAITVYNSHLQTAGKTIFVDKTPRYYHILPWLDQLFPKAQKIWLKRNPLDVASSYKKTWGAGPEIILGQKITSLSFDFAVGLFKLAAYFELPSPYKLEVQYEKLVETPQETLTDICDWLGVPFEATMLDYGQNQTLIARHNASTMGDKKALTTHLVHSQSIGRWVETFTLPELQQLIELLGFDIFRRLGYSDVIDSLQLLGLQAPSEAKAVEIRDRIGRSRINKIMELREEIEILRSKWQEAEADRAARLKVIHQLSERLQASEADRAARLDQIKALTQRLQESEADRAARLDQIEKLTQLLQKSEADRAARLEVIQSQEQIIQSQERTLNRPPVRLLRRLRLI